MPEEVVLGVQETLIRLKISRKTLYVLINEGKIRPIDKPSYLKKRAKLQFTENEVNRLIAGDSPGPSNRAA